MNSSIPPIGDDHRHRLDQPDELLVVDGALIVGQLRVGSVRLEDEVRTILIVDGWRNTDELPATSETLIISAEVGESLGRLLLKASESTTALAAELEAESVRQAAIDALAGGDR